MSVQRLSQLSSGDPADTETVPWMWTVLQHMTARHQQCSQPRLSTISADAELVAFFHLMSQLPSTAIVTCHRWTPAVKVVGLDQLLNAINDLARNTADVCVLPPDLTLHVVMTLASLPATANDDLHRFLTNCPLIALSAMFHSNMTRSAANLACCSNVVTDLFNTVASSLDEASSLLDGATLTCPSTVPAWSRGAALWTRLRNSQYSMDASRLRTDADTAEALLHCLTVDLAAGMLCEDVRRQPVEDVIYAVWWHHTSALRCLLDSDAERSSVAEVFRRCVPCALQRLQPLACLSVFSRAVDDDRLTSWDVTRAMRWYIHCAELFDSGQCSDSKVLAVIKHASQSICYFATTMPRSQLQTVSQTILDAIDPHIRILFHQLSNA